MKSGAKVFHRRGAKAQRALLNILWKPLVIEWLKKPRMYHYRGLRLNVLPGVFHPGFFYSSRILADFVSGLSLKGKLFLDVGCGSGLVALAAAKQGAKVTALDINPLAVECTQQNAKENGLPVEAHVSDLFDTIPPLRFDILAVNPPFYRKPASTMAERAWNAGAELEYFQAFFSALGKITLAGSEVFMILSDDCDMKGITDIAAANGFLLRPLKQYRRMGEVLSTLQIIRRQ